jgi:AraC-like DNA-binding protein
VGARAQWWVPPVPAGLRPYVRSVHGYRLTGAAPGVHVGMPSPALTLVVALGEPVVVAVGGGERRAFASMAAGLHDRAAAIHHDGSQHGLQLDLTPAGCRALLGLPASELAGRAVDLGDLLDVRDRRLAEQAEAVDDWPARVDLVLAALTRRLDAASSARPEVEHAWHEVHRTHGLAPVRAVADAVGWSPRHLGEQFRAEYGLGVKTAARVARFSRSARLVRAQALPLAEVAAVCGYFDQAHLAREWRALAGTTPTRWIRDDGLAFVQDQGAGGTASSGS